MGFEERRPDYLKRWAHGSWLWISVEKKKTNTHKTVTGLITTYHAGVPNTQVSKFYLFCYKLQQHNCTTMLFPNSWECNKSIQDLKLGAGLTENLHDVRGRGLKRYVRVIKHNLGSKRAKIWWKQTILLHKFQNSCHFKWLQNTLCMQWWMSGNN